MTQRWMVLIAVFGLVPMLLAMQPVDDALITAAIQGDLGEVTRVIEKGPTPTRRTRMESLRFTGRPKRDIKTLWRCCWTKARILIR